MSCFSMHIHPRSTSPCLHRGALSGLFRVSEYSLPGRLHVARNESTRPISEHSLYVSWHHHPVSQPSTRSARPRVPHKDRIGLSSIPSSPTISCSPLTALAAISRELAQPPSAIVHDSCRLTKSASCELFCTATMYASCASVTSPSPLSGPHILCCHAETDPSLGCMTADGHLRPLSKLQPPCGAQETLPPAHRCSNSDYQYSSSMSDVTLLALRVSVALCKAFLAPMIPVHLSHTSLFDIGTWFADRGTSGAIHCPMMVAQYLGNHRTTAIDTLLWHSRSRWIGHVGWRGVGRGVCRHI